jgi:integral membrane sensor domain MASE1
VRRPHSTLAIIGFLLGGLLLACVVSAALGVAWYVLFGAITGGALTPTPRP